MTITAEEASERLDVLEARVDAAIIRLGAVVERLEAMTPEERKALLGTPSA